MFVACVVDCCLFILPLTSAWKVSVCFSLLMLFLYLSLSLFHLITFPSFLISFNPSRSFFITKPSMHLRFSIKFVLVQTFRMDYIASTLFILFIFILLSIKHQFLIVCITIRPKICVCMRESECVRCLYVHFQFGVFIDIAVCCYAIRGIRFFILLRKTVPKNEWDSIQNVCKWSNCWEWKRKESWSQWVDRFLWLFILAICWWNMVHVNVFRCKKHGQNKNDASTIPATKTIKSQK